MSELGYMHRRVQVEVAWFIALSDAGSGGFKPLSPGARTYLLGLVKNFSPADGEAIKAIEKTTNHDVKAVEYWLKSKFEARRRAAKRRRVRALCLHQRRHQQHQPRAACSALARDVVILPLLDKLIAATARHGPRACRRAPCSAAPTAKPPARPPWARKSPTWWRACKRARDSASPTCSILAKMNGAVGNYNAHLTAWPEFDWEAFRAQRGRGTGTAWARTAFSPTRIQIEPHDYMAELFDAIARTNTILIDWSRDVWGYVSLGYFKQKLQGRRGRLHRPCRTRSTRSTSKTPRATWAWPTRCCAT